MTEERLCTEHGAPENDCPDCDHWAATFLQQWALGLDDDDDTPKETRE